MSRLLLCNICNIPEKNSIDPEKGGGSGDNSPILFVTMLQMLQKIIFNISLIPHLFKTAVYSEMDATDRNICNTPE